MSLSDPTVQLLIGLGVIVLALGAAYQVLTTVLRQRRPRGLSVAGGARRRREHRRRAALEGDDDADNPGPQS